MANEAETFDDRTPLTEGQIRAATIGTFKPLSGPTRVVNNDPRWPGFFTREAHRVRAALGPDALQIEHVGSTSVPGLAAKPIIDMLLVVAGSTARRPGDGRPTCGNATCLTPASFASRSFAADARPRSAASRSGARPSCTRSTAADRSLPPRARP
jgi:hypothetical protein